MKIIETDNFDGDYPDEKFVNLPWMTMESADQICDIINKVLSSNESQRFWRAVRDDYKLVPGFEP